MLYARAFHHTRVDVQSRRETDFPHFSTSPCRRSMPASGRKLWRRRRVFGHVYCERIDMLCFVLTEAHALKLVRPEHIRNRGELASYKFERDSFPAQPLLCKPGSVVDLEYLCCILRVLFRKVPMVATPQPRIERRTGVLDDKEPPAALFLQMAIE